MPDPVVSAVDKFQDGYSCSQSILMVFAAQIGISEETAVKIASPFGGGIARSGETCGAITGALMVLGLKYGPEGNTSKDIVYQVSNDFMCRVKSEFGSTLCKHLIEYDISQAEEMQAARASNVFKSICPELVRRIAEILVTLLDSPESQ